MQKTVTMALSCTVFDIFDFENAATFKSWSGVTQVHRNWCHFIAFQWFPIGVLW